MTTQTTIATSNPPFRMPRLLLHLEGAAILLAALSLYASHGFSWGAFALFLLAPDLAAVFYLADRRLGSIIYNLAHTILFPLILGLYSLSTNSTLGLQVALIWFAHIGMDRAAGYGFKYLGEFKETHFSHL